MCRSTSERFDFFCFSLFVQMKHWTSVKWYFTHLLKEVTQIRELHRYVAGTLFFFRVVAFILRVRSFRQNRCVDRVVAHINARTQSQSRGPNTVTHLCVPTTEQSSVEPSTQSAQRVCPMFCLSSVSHTHMLRAYYYYPTIWREKKITINLLSWQNVT